MNIIIIICGGAASSLPGIIGVGLAIVLFFSVFIGTAKLVAPWLCVAPALTSMVLQESYGIYICLGVLAVCLVAGIIGSKTEAPLYLVSLCIAGLLSVATIVTGILLEPEGGLNIFEIVILLLFGIPLFGLLLYPMSCGLTALCSAPSLAYNPKWFISALCDFVSLIAGLLFFQALMYVILGFFGNAQWCDLTVRFTDGGFFDGLNIPYSMQQTLTQLIAALNRIPVMVRLIGFGVVTGVCTALTRKLMDR